MQTGKRIIVMIIATWWLGVATASVSYYVSASGNDLDNGLSPATAWRSITKVNSMIGNIAPGDKILFKCGGSFYGSLIITKSGTVDNPIVIGAYGTGTKPVITGFKKVESWVNVKNNIWESKTAVSNLANCNMVLINGANVPMGRYPNEGYLTLQSHLNNSSITSNDLKGSVNWTGAEVVIRMYHWFFDRNIITGQSGSTLNYKSTDSIFKPTDGFGFFIQNNAQTLDTPNEWYYNPESGKLKVYNTKVPGNVMVASIDSLLQVSNQHFITISNISFRGANKIAIESKGNNIRVKNCDFDYTGSLFINAQKNADYLVIDSCSFNHANSGAINSGLSNHVSITNNSFSNTAVQPGMGSVDFSNYKAIVCIGNYGNISGNKIDSTGYIPIIFDGDSTLVLNNFIKDYCFVLDDGGGIYCYSEHPAVVRTTRTIRNNIVLNGIGAGIGTDNSPGYNNLTAGVYLDASTGNYEVKGNTLANADKGIFLNNSHEVVIDSNVLYNNAQNIYVRNYNKSIRMKNITVRNNSFISLKNGQWAINAELLKDSIMPATFVVDNNYYAQPSGDSLLMRFYNVQVHKKYTLNAWRQSSSQDKNSKNSTRKISGTADTRFEYNATNIPKSVTLSNNYTDLKGISYSKTLVLPPYSSVVLIRQ